MFPRINATAQADVDFYLEKLRTLQNFSYLGFKDGEEIVDGGLFEEILKDFMTAMHCVVFAKDFTDQVGSVIYFFNIAFRLEFLDNFLQHFTSLLLYYKFITQVIQQQFTL